MKINILSYVLILFFFIFNNSAYSKSPVWKVSKNGHHLFIGGTIHMLSQSDFPLPSAFEAAYNNSVLLVIETDLQKFNSPEFQQTILEKNMYSGKQNIKQFLKPNTVKDLETHLESRGIPIESMLKFKAGMLSITLTVVELQRMGLVGTGVDQFYNLRALNDNRKINHLETVYDQIDFISKMGEGNENELIEYTLNDLKNLAKIINSIKKAWKDGEVAKLQKVALDPWRDRFPNVYNSFLVDRNNNWIPKIEEMIKTKEVELVLFGALHLVGESGILKQLEALGYDIENL